MFRFYLAESANVRKDYAGAIKQYRVLLDGQPENPMLLNNLAWVMAQTKDAKALELAEKPISWHRSSLRSWIPWEGFQDKVNWSVVWS